MQLFSLRIPLEIHEKLRVDAFNSRISMNTLIIKILEEYLKNKAAA